MKEIVRPLRIPPRIVDRQRQNIRVAVDVECGRAGLETVGTNCIFDSEEIWHITSA